MRGHRKAKGGFTRRYSPHGEDKCPDIDKIIYKLLFDLVSNLRPRRAALKISEIKSGGTEWTRCRHRKEKMSTSQSMPVIRWYPEEKVTRGPHPTIIRKRTLAESRYMDRQEMTPGFCAEYWTGDVCAGRASVISEYTSKRMNPVLTVFYIPQSNRLVVRAGDDSRAVW